MYQLENIINTIIHGNSLDILSQIPDACIDMAITSPPYFGKRDYSERTEAVWGGLHGCEHEWGGDIKPSGYRSNENRYSNTLTSDAAQRRDMWRPSKICTKCAAWKGQLGLEPTPSLYIQNLVGIFTEVMRVLKPYGSLYVNLGDTYAGYWGNQNGDGTEYGNLPVRGHNQNKRGKLRTIMDEEGIQPKSQFCIPERFVQEMVRIGYIKRNTLIWFKPNTMPYSGSDRFTEDFEYIFFFTKSSKPLYRTNEKTLELATKPPKGTGGIEGSDWCWIPCPNCNKPKEAIQASLEEPDEPPQQENGACKRCGGLGRIKQSYWQSHDYYFEQQFEPIQESSTERNKYAWNSNQRTYSPTEKRGADHRPAGELFNPLGRNKRTVWDIPEETFAVDVHGEAIEITTSELEYIFQNRTSRAKASVWDIVTKPLKESHYACVDAETECLTITGWKKYTDLKIGEIIASFDMKSGLLRWERLMDLYIYDYDAELIHFANPRLGFIYTPNHRVVCKQWRAKTKHWSEFKTKPAEKITSCDYLPISSIWEEGSFGMGNDEPSENISEILGWICAEGHMNKQSISIYQSIMKNPEKVERIENLLNEEGIKHAKYISEKKSGTRKGYKMAVFFISYQNARNLIRYIPDKKPTSNMILWSKNGIERFLSGFIGGDGHIRSDGRITISQKDEETTDLLQIMAFRLGYRVIKSTKKEYPKNPSIFALYLTKARLATIRNTNGGGIRKSTTPYKGIVWCPKTPSKTFVARRHGRIIITGNSYPQELIETPIKASCPEFVCKKCGMPRVKVFKKQTQDNYNTPKYQSKYLDNNYGQPLQGFVRSNSIATEREMSREKAKELHPNNHKAQKEHIKFVHDHGGLKSAEVAGYTDCGCGEGFTPGIVLDMFMGSGTTAITAKELGRRYIGCELNPDYIKIAQRRIEHIKGTQKRMDFFEGTKEAK